MLVHFMAGPYCFSSGGSSFQFGRGYFGVQISWAVVISSSDLFAANCRQVSYLPVMSRENAQKVRITPILSDFLEKIANFCKFLQTFARDISAAYLPQSAGFSVKK